MAFISAGLIDYGGTRRRTGIHVQDDAALSEYSDGAQAFLNQLDGITGCRITDCFIQLPIALPGSVKATPTDGEEAERGLLLSYASAGRYSYGLWVPGIAQVHVSGEDPIVTNAPIVGINTIMVTGTTGAFGDLIPHNGHGVDITAFQGGRITFRRK